MARLNVSKDGVASLDVKSDPFALGALKAYASAARNEGEDDLADKVEAFVDGIEKADGEAASEAAAAESEGDAASEDEE